MQDWESHLQISRPDLEMALKVVDQAWKPLDGGASTSGDTAVVTPPVEGPVGDNSATY